MPKAERIDRAFRAEHLRKLHPKLLMILNGGRVVNQLRAERCASITVGSIDDTLDPLREPGARSARADLVQALADDQWEDPRRGGDDVLVDVFIRLCESGAERDPANWKRVELTGACNDLLTATLPLSCLSALSEDPAVNAVEIAERVDFFPPFNVQVVAGEERKAATPGASAGSGVVIGIIDVGGFDFAHLAFLDGKGETRFMEIWDQAGDTRPHPAGFGYGARITRRHMQRAIDAWRHGKSNGLPATELEPQSLRIRSSHATHVASIAAGSHGVCPGADIVGVSLALPSEDTDRRKSFYDSSRLAHAVDYILGVAAGRPVSINISLGTNGHAHDGSSALNRWLDHQLQTPGPAVTVAAGNAGQEAPTSKGDLGFIEGRIHTSGRIPAAGLSRELEWIVVGIGEGDMSENELEIWYGAQDRFAIEIAPPGEAPWSRLVEPGDFIENEVLDSGTVLSRLQRALRSREWAQPDLVLLEPVSFR